MSPDGRFVAFESGRLYSRRQRLYIRDMHTRRTTLVSRHGYDAYPASISADGRFVAFGAEGRTGTGYVFVRDLREHTTTLVSRANGPRGASGNAAGGLGSYGGWLSADGRLLVFSSDASNLAPGIHGHDFSGVYLRDLQAHTTTLITPGDNGVLSADGHSVAFDASPHTLNAVNSDQTGGVYVRDLRSGTTTLASRASGPDGAAGNDDSNYPAISADGQRVAFLSVATNLSPDASGTIAVNDVFVRDLTSQTTILVSRATGLDGPKGNHRSDDPAISADGRVVAFDSRASNLTPDDPDKSTDVFVREL
jgi:Tol biopolymer transport system component